VARSPARRRAEADALASVTPIRWRDLRPAFLDAHEQGEHVAIIGPTGQGKTTLAYDLLDGMATRAGASVVCLVNKARDAATVDLGWPVIERWPPDYQTRVGRRVVLWPRYRGVRRPRANAGRFLDALDAFIAEGSWTVYVDEVPYFTEQLGLRRQLDEYWHTARSSHVTVVGSSQEVSWIPAPFKTQQSWLFCFRPRTQEVVKSVAEVCGDRDRFRPILGSLGHHEFLLVDSITEQAWVSKLGT